MSRIQQQEASAHSCRVVVRTGKLCEVRRLRYKACTVGDTASYDWINRTVCAAGHKIANAPGVNRPTVMFAFNTRPAGYRRAAALRRWRSSAWCGTPLPSRDACFIASLRYPATPYLHVSTGSVKAKIQGKDVTDSVKAKIQGKDVTDSVKAKIQDKGVTD
ncbi:hypothetical protein AURDEDRAFT_173006, partial [Auricularia subglabra TFB-10046 SS5]